MTPDELAGLIAAKRREIAELFPPVRYRDAPDGQPTGRTYLIVHMKPRQGVPWGFRLRTSADDMKRAEMLLGVAKLDGVQDVTELKI